MKIYYPYKTKPVITQRYSQNLNTYYAEDGNLGHGAWDMAQKHNSEIICAVAGKVISIINQDNPNLMAYRAVYTFVECDGVAYEISYGHLNEIYTEVGKTLEIGDLIGTQGNTGDVASGGVKITKTMKDAGSTAGSHLHFAVRLLKKVDKKEKGKTYLFTKVNGSYYEIPLYNNGYKGCIDPAQFMQDMTAYQYKNGLIAQIIENISPTPVQRTLRYGMRGDDVKKLQKALNIKVDGVFGVKTEKAVKEFQKKNKLTIDGLVGKQTRIKLNI